MTSIVDLAKCCLMARPLARDICVLIIIGLTDTPFWLPSAFVLGVDCELIREACCLGCVNILLCNEELCSAMEGNLEHVTSPSFGYALSDAGGTSRVPVVRSCGLW